MTVTEPIDQTALFRAILHDPDDDTVRLVYADWLSENGQEDRGELIRVQCELASLGSPVPNTDRVCELAHRESALLAAHKEWSSCPCPKCGGTGDRLAGYPMDCYLCDGTGDLLCRGDEPRTRITGWSRGFPVVGCTLAEVAVERNCHWVKHGTGKTWEPTPWAKALAAPGVRFVELALTDVDGSYHNGAGYCWFKKGRGREGADVPTASELPPFLFDLLEGWNVSKTSGTRWRPYTTSDAVVTALGRACARWVFAQKFD